MGMDKEGKPWWPTVLSVKPNSGGNHSQKRESRQGLPQAGSEEQQPSSEPADNNTWIQQVQEFYMTEEEGADGEGKAGAPAALAAPEEVPGTSVVQPPAASPGPAAAAPALSPQTDQEASAATPAPADNAGKQAGQQESSGSPAPTKVAAPAVLPGPALLFGRAAGGGGAYFVSEATLSWEEVAEASVDLEAEALQHEAVIEQEQEAGDGSEVEAFGERYSASDPAGSSIASAGPAPALAPAPAPSPEHASDPCAAALGIPKV